MHKGLLDCFILRKKRYKTISMLRVYRNVFTSVRFYSILKNVLTFYRYVRSFMMSKNKHSNSNFLNEMKDKQENNNTDKHIEKDRTYIQPTKFQSKEPKKDDQAFFVSRINKPAKYTKNPNFFSYLIYRISKDDASGMAAQLSYYFMLSLFPMLIFLLSIVPMLGADPHDISDMIIEYVPQEYSEQVQGVIEEIFNASSGGTLSIGLIVALWSASNGMTAIMNAFNVAYDVEDKRNFVVSKLSSVLFTLAMVIVLPIALILPTFGGVIGDFIFGPLGLGDEVKWLFNLVRVILPFLIVFVSFIVLYTLAPNVKIKIMSVLPGTAFSTVLFLVGAFLFSFYISNFANYNKTYGSLAGIIILMLWLYITGFILIIGAEINAILHQRKIVRGRTPEEQEFHELEQEEANAEQEDQKENADDTNGDTSSKAQPNKPSSDASSDQQHQN